MGFIPQGNRPGSLGEIILFAFILSPDIGVKRTLPGFRPGRLIVDNTLMGHKQGDQAINQRRFTGADITGEQSVMAAGFNMPDLAVECAPVIKFQPVEAKSCLVIRGGEIKKSRLHDHGIPSDVR